MLRVLEIISKKTLWTLFKIIVIGTIIFFVAFAFHRYDILEQIPLDPDQWST